MGAHLSYYVVLIQHEGGYQERVVVADPSLLDVPYTIVGKVEPHADTLSFVSLKSRTNGEAAFVPTFHLNDALDVPLREPYRPPEWVTRGAVLVTPRMPTTPLRVVEVDVVNERVVVEKAFPRPNERNDPFAIWERHLSGAEPTIDRFEREEVL